MTTEHDHGEIGVRMIRCTLDAAGIYRSRVLAVRDMRTAQGRDPVSGHGAVAGRTDRLGDVDAKLWRAR